MIKPLNSPQLSAAKPRCGLHSISDLLPRLIRQYEMQAELMNRARQSQPAPAPIHTEPAQQSTFAWYE